MPSDHVITAYHVVGQVALVTAAGSVILAGLLLTIRRDVTAGVVSVLRGRNKAPSKSLDSRRHHAMAIVDDMRRGDVVGFDVKPGGDVDLAVRLQSGEVLLVSIGAQLLAGIAEASAIRRGTI